MIEMLTKTPAKITIIVLQNREPYYFSTICKRKEGQSISKIKLNFTNN